MTVSKTILDEDFVPVLTEKQKKTKKINRFITESHDRIQERKLVSIDMNWMSYQTKWDGVK